MRPQPSLVLAAIAVAVVACDNMANQPKRLPFELPVSKIAEPHWPALPPAGTVAREDESEPMPAPPLTLALLERGHERFDIACAPCHGRAGDGHGMIVERGFPAPPALDLDRLRAAPVQHFYDVVTNGYGAMFSNHIGQADEGCDFDFLSAHVPVPEPEIH